MWTMKALNALALAGMLAACAAPAGPYASHSYSSAGIPPGHLPPPGECRIWYPDRPPGHQPPPGPCERLKYNVPPGAQLVYGGSGGGSYGAPTYSSGPSTGDGAISKQTAGLFLGAAAGGLAGSQIGSGTGRLAAVGGGVFLGALIGSEIGRSMDEVDRMKAEQAYARAATAPVGQQIAWNNPQTGNHGTIMPLREGTSASGSYCREFQQDVTIGNKTERAYGTACRQPNGSWKIIDS